MLENFSFKAEALEHTKPRQQFVPRTKNKSSSKDKTSHRHHGVHHHDNLNNNSNNFNVNSRTTLNNYISKPDASLNELSSKADLQKMRL